jgi:hypothetical protein
MGIVQRIKVISLPEKVSIRIKQRKKMKKKKKKKKIKDLQKRICVWAFRPNFFLIKIEIHTLSKNLNQN